MQAVRKPNRSRVGPLRVGYVGRIFPIKGLHVLVKAVRVLDQSVNLLLDIYGPESDEESRSYRAELDRMAAGDNRIQFRGALSTDRIPEVMGTYDVLAVPSQCLETGPLVALEAQAVGVPILGLNLGGIAELVKHDRDGWLLRYDDVGAWSSALDRLCRDRGILERLSAGIGPVRTMRTVAEEMAAIYQGLLAA